MSCIMSIKKTALTILIISYIRIILVKRLFSKNEYVVWKIECQLGFITDKDCPIDGGWSAWGSWGPCHGPCDDIGHMQRIRECINPPPSNEGSSCSGLSVQTNTCYLTNCKVDDFRKLVAGDPFRCEALHQLETVEALLERCLQIECSFESIQNSLACDNTWQHNPESIWNSLQCVKHNVGCPLFGEWGSWGEWSTCSARCGQGFKWRLRKCDSPPPSDIYLTCEGDTLQSKTCEGDQCAIEEQEISKDLESYWCPWSAWSACSQKCGIGVKRRKRICVSKNDSHGNDIWRTNCLGPHDELNTCVNKDCNIDGNWVSWGPWGPCSTTCGIGKQSRIRSCTRPKPSEGGKPCSGSRTEITSCYLNPCESFTHLVAVFNGDGYIHYNIERKRSTLLHVYIRFKTQSQFGTLLRRGTKNSSHVRLTLQNWHICVDVSGEAKSCDVSRLCSLNTLEPSSWHSVMVSVTTKVVNLHVDNFQPSIIGKFPCNPTLSEETHNFYIGERFYGEIEEIIINFIPLNLKAESKQKYDYIFSPYTVSNIVYEKTTIEEAFLIFSDEQYLIIPCFDNQEEWNIDLKFKSSKESGLLLFLLDEQDNNWLMVYLQNEKIKLKLAVGDFKSESSSSSKYSCNQWVDIRVIKKTYSNTIEVNINMQESLHVPVIDKQIRKRRYGQHFIRKSIDKKKYNKAPVDYIVNYITYSYCNDEFYVGGFPHKLIRNFHEDMYSFFGVISSIALNGILLDLQKCHIERNTNQMIQISSRTASISGSYHEIYWGKSRMLNLSCLHTRKGKAAHAAQWYQLDIRMENPNPLGEQTRSVDDGRILRLQTPVNDKFVSFYTCRAHGIRKARNIITYGIVGKSSDFEDKEILTTISVCTTLLLLLITLGWLFLEGVNDLRNGFGFFRDQHLSQEEKAEAICAYIDRNSQLIGSKSFVVNAKYRARQTVEKQKKEFNKYSDDSSSISEDESLSDSPELDTDSKPPHEVYKCELSFISSPRHGSQITLCSQKANSSSTFDFPPPRSDLLLKGRNLMKQNNSILRRSLRCVDKKHSTITSRKYRMPTIISSRILNLSPAQRVLYKFQQLK